MTAAEKKLARKRLSALELAEKLGNVSEACRRRGLSRTQFDEYKRRFQTPTPGREPLLFHRLGLLIPDSSHLDCAKYSIQAIYPGYRTSSSGRKE